MTTVPFTAEVTLTVPPDAGLPDNELPFTVANTYTQKAIHRLELTGSGSHTVGFGTIASPGAKLIIIAIESGTAVSPIVVKMNGATVGQEVSPGGWMALASPDPTTGITTMAIDHTTNATVKVWILG